MALLDRFHCTYIFLDMLITSNFKPLFLFRLALAEDEVRTLRSKAGLLTDYDTQVRRLRDDIALLTARRDSLLRSSPIKDDTILPSKDESKRNGPG